ncbi:transglutaminase-like domain-containing protein [Paraburkholderia caballeronis]|uniref:transglutaminase-like domain-containing protein n=1 Tax=Paraburkholderia caballeronis TaxID=416943 RepID=UPI00106552A4|nr:transglutaminase family protein [Paraburkholderia caballeronis]TDV19626.1 transglutaminase-like putative cysteine protease [Paraburkholderia caballeronis]TDV22225.1 transglutaminase-like putative cysteine protease [Paraburkholderia caballeronis]TDV29129.1 transglutaminase-like putative cysteine protease [Paraburkholderia caballeronis]
MKLRVGYELSYECEQDTPMMLMLSTHYSRVQEVVSADLLVVDPPVAIRQYRDGFGNLCSRLVAPPGRITMSTTALLDISDQPEAREPYGYQHPVDELPDECMVFLLGSRYCETDLLSDIAWKLFDEAPPGRDRVQAICDFVHGHIVFGYEFARPTKTAWQAYHEKRGVCRDFAHLAVALCRAMNIPARYCTGYISDVGEPLPYGTMDFAAWFEAYVGGCWQTFDPRNNVARIGRVLMARGRDAADVALSNTFGPVKLVNFTVHCAPEEA